MTRPPAPAPPGDPSGPSAGPGGTRAAGARDRGPAGGPAPADATGASGWTADEAVTRLFATHYRPMVRLAALLLRDASQAEELVQDAFVALHGRWTRLRDPERAVAYLRQSVVNAARSALRHRGVVDRFLGRQAAPATEPSAEVGALAAETQAEVLAAVRNLPARQREALVLRYYADLSEAQTAETMGVSAGSVKSHTARALAALRLSLGRTLGPPS